MKKYNIFLVMLIVIAGVFTLQSCTQDDSPIPKVQNTYNVPTATAPLSDATISPTTKTVLNWNSTGGSTKWSVYFDNGLGVDNLKQIRQNHSSDTVNVAVAEGKTYHWQVETVDANGVITKSSIFAFTVDVTPTPKIVYNIDDFVGTYSVMEGTYGHYTVHLTKVNSNTLQNDNFWDNAPNPLWVIQYVFDDYGNVTLTPSTYRTAATSMTVYSVTGSGTYNVTTKGLSVDYTVIKNVYTLHDDGTTTTVKTTADAATDVMTKQ